MKFFKDKKIFTLLEALNKEGGAEKYWQSERFKFNDGDFVVDNSIPNLIENLILVKGNNKSDDDYKNAIAIYEALPGLSYAQASDTRLWTYLTHGPFFDYVQYRYPLKVNSSHNERALYVQRHWFINPINWYNFIRSNAISRLWWMVALSIDPVVEDKYHLTKELFSMQDYSSHLLTYPLGRSINFRHAVLEFISIRPALFANAKEAKVRFIMRTVSLEAGRMIVGMLSKDEIVGRLLSLESKIATIAD